MMKLWPTMKRRFCQVKFTAKFYFIYILTRFFKNDNKELWLLSERGIDARDNGLFFYNYLKSSHPEIRLKYVISNNSPDRKKINGNDIVRYRSFQHYMLYIQAKYLVSTHYQGYSPDFELFGQLDRRGLIRVNGKKIFLQHGIIKDKANMSKKTRPLDLFICGAQEEYDALLAETDYGDNILKYTGLARYDNLFCFLEKPVKKQILVMPTWRVKFAKATEKDFLNSDYYKNYNQLINDPDLNDYLEKNNIRLVFYPHIEMHRFLHLFECDKPHVQISGMNQNDVQKLLIESKLLITDFSSVFFDFAYQKKPVIFFQFDKKDYRSSHYEEGWFSYEHDGFGPVIENKNAVVAAIPDLFTNGMSQIYMERVNRIFKRRDNHNCDRIFTEIQRLG
ncbi:MAG: CDP-glycerol--poly(glycerophosphate) glycerophosphotransferase [Lachnospiraceae bacterium]|nr:CDP-glycerol--poly(glycerophosphate) glycerophosphotransferase [Lachnospiraceae bacterium]